MHEKWRDICNAFSTNYGGLHKVFLKKKIGCPKDAKFMD